MVGRARGQTQGRRGERGRGGSHPVSHTVMRRPCGGASIVKDKGVQRSMGYSEMSVLAGIPGEQVPPSSTAGRRESWGGEVSFGLPAQGGFL